MSEWILPELLMPVFYCECVKIENMIVVEVRRVLIGVNTFNMS